jgi:L-alanine-DL-glutamate epimerase-like enolase superfamily enzyme
MGFFQLWLPFCNEQEDLENALSRAFKQQQRVNPSLRANTDIHVGSFEDVLKRMESNEEETGWGDIVFIPPGIDALKHLGKAKGTVVG